MQIWVFVLRGGRMGSEGFRVAEEEEMEEDTKVEEARIA